MKNLLMLVATVLVCVCAQAQVISPITNGVLRTNLNGNGFTITNLPSITLTTDDAYNATSWNGSLAVPTKNAVRDKIEAIPAGESPLTFVSPIQRSTNTISFGNINANYFLAGPTTGTSVAPTFRAMVNADIPLALLSHTYDGIALHYATAGGTTDAPSIITVVTVDHSFTLTKLGWTSAGGIDFRTNGPRKVAFYSDGIVQMVKGANSGTADDTKVAAGTLALGSATGLLFDITGNTTVTSITGVGNGEERILRFTGAPFLTHGSSLLLPGAQSYQAVVGDIVYILGKASGVVKVTRIIHTDGSSAVSDIDGGAIANVDFNGSNRLNGSLNILSLGSINTAGGNINTSGIVSMPIIGSLISSSAIGTSTISDIPNLTSNGFVTTSGGTGTLGVDTTPYAPLASPGLTGNPQTPTQTFGNNSTRIASTAFVQAAVAAKADINSPTLTGVPLSTTAAADTNTTQIATNAFVLGQAASSTPAPNGSAAIGTSLRYARADHVHAAQTTITGNAGTATTLATGRTLSITGDIAWTSPSFDGSGNVTAAGTIGATKVTSVMLNSDVFSTAHSWGGIQTFTTPVLGAATGTSVTVSGNAGFKNTGNVQIGDPPGSGYPGIWFGSNVTTPSYTNYAFLFDSAGGTIINTPSGLQMLFRVNNSTVFAISGTAGAFTGNFAVSGNLSIGGGTSILKVLSATATLDFASTGAQANTDLTITVTGAALGDVVDIGVPNGSVLAGGSYSGWVSATNTVTVRFENYSLLAKDPASGTFRAQVTQF